jgi:mycoredoxin
VHDIDQQPDNEALFAVLAEIEPELARRWEAQSSGAAQRSGAAQSSEAAQAGQTQQPETPPQKLVLYCTPWCPDCKRARRFLESHGVPYVEVDISRDRAAAQRIRAWAGGQEITPTFEFKGKVVLDYNLEQLTELLGIEDD